MQEKLAERADELGRLLGQTPEYGALKRARERMAAESALVRLMERLEGLERQIGEALQRGEEPAAELQAEYEQVFSELQGSPAFQGVIAAQSNFDRVLGRVNEAIAQGMERGSGSRIIMPS
jgi:cell fate (sporulation/competence/biofilm development) regulator YlbF (YheA/YmcA/DUF963 family)